MNRMLYLFPKERAGVTYPFVFWDGIFSDEELKKVVEYCETLEKIEDAIEEKLKRLVGTKNKLLQAQGIPPEIDIRPLIASANKSAAWLKQKKNETEQGTLAPTAPAPGL